MKDFISIFDELFVWVALAVAIIYGPLARSWFKSIGIVLFISLLSSLVGVYDIMLAADGRKNILACLVFPIILLIIAIITRSIRLVIFPIHKKKKLLFDEGGGD